MKMIHLLLRNYPKVKTCLMILVIIASMIPVQAAQNNAVNEIAINSDQQQLIAPEGRNYTWYLNGNKVNGEDQNYIQAHESGEYRVEYEDKTGQKKSKTIQVAVEDGKIRKIFIIGDSTVSTYRESDYPQTGWGQVLQLYFDNSQIDVLNHAIGGRSSRSFHEQGRWTDVVNSLSAGDYVFIQFGHNDRDWTKEERYTDTAQYKDYLRIYVNETREKNATPVLISPMIMNAYSGTRLRNVFREGENDYRGAMLEVANELDAHFVDLNIKSWQQVDSVGQEYATFFWFFSLLPGEYPNYPDGHSDGTHFQEMGALEMARLITQGIQELPEDTSVSHLTSALKPLYPVQVDMTNPHAGEITKSSEFPVGANVTIKTKLNDGFTFMKWEDDSANTITSENLYQFTMTADPYNFHAVVSDCYGTPNGKAYYDDCDFCTGGETGWKPCQKQFQTERACSFTGDAEYVTIHDVKRRVINNMSADSSIYLFSIEASQSGNYDFGLVYQTNASLVPVNIKVNGEDINSIMELEATEDWGMVNFPLSLTEGNNIIEITIHSQGHEVLFDMLSSSSDSLTTGDCAITAIRPLNHSDHPTSQVYPNPFEHTLKLTAVGNFQYELYTPQGTLLERGSCNHSCNIGDALPNGLYMLRIVLDKTEVDLHWISKQ